MRCGESNDRLKKGPASKTGPSFYAGTERSPQQYGVGVRGGCGSRMRRTSPRGPWFRRHELFWRSSFVHLLTVSLVPDS
jgi:hypothetical protein